MGTDNSGYCRVICQCGWDDVVLGLEAAEESLSQHVCEDA